MAIEQVPSHPCGARSVVELAVVPVDLAVTALFPLVDAAPPPRAQNVQVRPEPEDLPLKGDPARELGIIHQIW